MSTGLVLALARSSMLGRSESPVEDFMNVRFWPKAASFLEHIQDELMTASTLKRPLCYGIYSRPISSQIAHFYAGQRAI